MSYFEEKNQLLKLIMLLVFGLVVFAFVVEAILTTLPTSVVPSTYSLNDECNCTVKTVLAVPTYGAGTAETVDGTQYQSSSQEPLSLWYNESVWFNGSSDPHMYKFAIDCSRPCWIKNISFDTAQSPSTTTSFRLYDNDNSNQMYESIYGGSQRFSWPLRFSGLSQSFFVSETQTTRTDLYRRGFEIVTSRTEPTHSSAPHPLNSECNCTATRISTSRTQHMDDPLGLWDGQDVSFLDVNDGGNETLFDYEIQCAIPCKLESFTVEGRFSNSTIAIFSADKSETLSSIQVRSAYTSAGYVYDQSITLHNQHPYVSDTYRVVETVESANMPRGSSIVMNYRSHLIVETSIATLAPTVVPTNQPSVLPTSINTSLLPTARRGGSAEVQEDPNSGNDDEQAGSQTDDSFMGSMSGIAGSNLSFWIAGGCALGMGILCCLFCVLFIAERRKNNKLKRVHQQLESPINGPAAKPVARPANPASILVPPPVPGIAFNNQAVMLASASPSLAANVVASASPSFVPVLALQPAMSSGFPASFLRFQRKKELGEVDNDEGNNAVEMGGTLRANVHDDVDNIDNDEDFDVVVDEAQTTGGTRGTGGGDQYANSDIADDEFVVNGGGDDDGHVWTNS